MAVGSSLHLLPASTHPERYDLTRAPGVLLLVDAWTLHPELVFNLSSWSVSALFAIYVVFPLIDAALEAAGRWAALLPLAAALAVEAIARQLIGGSATDLHADFGWLRALPSFLFGVWLARRTLPVLPKTALLLLAAGFLLVAVVGQPRLLYGLPRFATVCGGVALVALMDQAGVRSPLSWKPLADRARDGYGVFMLHPVVGLFVFQAEGIWSGGPPTDVAAVGVAMMVSVLLAAASRRWFEPRAAAVIQTGLAELLSRPRQA